MKKFLKENIVFLLSMVFILVIFNIRLPYYISAPGGVIDISDRISYDEKEEYEGSLNMLYVTEYVATIPTYLMSYINKDWDREEIVKSKVSSDESVKDIDARNKIMLDNSLDNAKYVAYKASGMDVNVTKVVHQVVGKVIDNDFLVGDQVLKVNGENIESFDDVKEIINNSKIGDELVVNIIRDGKERVIKEKIREVDGSKALGIILMTDYDYEVSPEVEINFRKSESGSSGGLMMALTIYSAISGEDILKGRDIAGTGTIDINGNVGAIAGVKYKIMGAYKNDMDVVLVPRDNYEEAISVKNEKGYDMEIVSVDTFMDAINYLRG